MIRGGDEHQRIRICRRKMERCRQNGRRRVAALGFDQDRAGRCGGAGQLFGDDKAEIGVGDDHGCSVTRPEQAQRGRLKQRLIPEQWHELFGIAFARQGPKSGAGPSGKEDGGNARVGRWSWW